MRKVNFFRDVINVRPLLGISSACTCNTVSCVYHGRVFYCMPLATRFTRFVHKTGHWITTSTEHCSSQLPLLSISSAVHSKHPIVVLPYYLGFKPVLPLAGLHCCFIIKSLEAHTKLFNMRLACAKPTIGRTGLNPR